MELEPLWLLFDTLVEKRLLHPGMKCLFGDYSYHIRLWGLKTGCWQNLCFLYFFYTLFCLMCNFDKFVLTIIDVEGVGCMSTPKCYWMVIVVNLVGEVLCMPGQYRVFPPLAALIAARLRGMLATRHRRRSAGISAHLSNRAWRSSTRFWGGLSILVIARPTHPKHVLWSGSLVILQGAPS